VILAPFFPRSSTPRITTVCVCVCVCVRARAHDRYQMCNNDDSTHRECINWSDDNKVSALARSMHQWVPYVAGCASIASCAFQ
jgi:hypothetical protein